MQLLYKEKVHQKLAKPQSVIIRTVDNIRIIIDETEGESYITIESGDSKHTILNNKLIQYLNTLIKL